MKVLLAILAVGMGVCLVDSYGNIGFDDPEDLKFACEHLYPHHGSCKPKTGGPYSLSVADISGGGGKKVTISGGSFKGFILQGSSGTFSYPSKAIITVDCDGRPTVRHADCDPKDSFTVIWTGYGPVAFNGSAVKDWTQFYTLYA